jgi:hypothetical protein
MSTTIGISMRLIKSTLGTFFTAFCLVSLSADQAKAEMVEVGTAQSGDVVYINNKSLTSNGRFVEATVQLVYATPYRGVASSSDRTRVNCSYRSMIKLSTVFYDGYGKPVSPNLNRSDGWYAVTPGSLNEGVYNYLCNR